MASIVGHRDHLHEFAPFSMAQVGRVSNVAAAHSVSKGHDPSFTESLELDLAMDGVNADPVNNKMWSSMSNSVLVCDEDNLLIHFADEELAKDNDSPRWQSEDDDAGGDSGGVVEKELTPDVDNNPPTSPFSNPSPGAELSEEPRANTDVEQNLLEFFENDNKNEYCSGVRQWSSDGSIENTKLPSRPRNTTKATTGLMFFEWGKVILDPLRRSKIERWKTQKLSIIAGRSTPKKYPKRQSYAQSRQRKNGRFVNNKQE